MPGSGKRREADTTERTYVAPNPAADGAWVRIGGGSPPIMNTPDVVMVMASASVTSE